METLLSQGLLQLQVEYNSAPKQCHCWTCDHPFEMRDAEVTVCNARGDRYGEICPSCIAKGSSWLANRFHELTQFKPPIHPKRVGRTRVLAPTKYDNLREDIAITQISA
ncbi:MAG: hypothetical protein IGS48_22195 [Oscillatoriales cyanobacterium C42_A2020_001]|nr:hypothetical protein [Leptolyngbyaceae cyanobacterium C42_A2020_001]